MKLFKVEFLAFLLTKPVANPLALNTTSLHFGAAVWEIGLEISNLLGVEFKVLLLEWQGTK